MIQHRNEIRRVMIAVNVIDGAYEMIARKIGIKENTLALLYALDDGKAHSQKEICEEWLIPKTTLNTVTKECIDAGYIYLEQGAHKKEKQIRLTEQGREYAQQILSEVYDLEECSVSSASRAISADFIRTIEAFAAALKKNAEGRSER